MSRYHGDVYRTAIGNFGNGAGSKGNGMRESARFTLSANQDLSVADLLGSSFAQNGSIEAQFAAHLALAKRFTPSEDSPLTPEQLKTLRTLGYIQ